MNTLALCIPAYNAAKYLPGLLQSAKKQLIPFDEIWVYDDCSTDDTAMVAARYDAKVVRGDINRGCSFGKNALAQHTTCSWVHFHDADDDLLPNFTTLVHHWILRSAGQYDVLLLNFNYVDHKTGKLLGTANHDVDALQLDPLRYAISNKIVNFGVYNLDRFIAAGGFDLDAEVLYNEDNAFHLRLAKAGFSFDYLPEVTCVNYRYSESMSSSNRLKCAMANYHVLAKTVASHGDQYPLELARQLWYCIANLASCQAWAYVHKALQLCRQLGYAACPHGSLTFKTLTRVHPYTAVWGREKMIRLFKPQLRNDW
ncbi:hypothetical protein GCM10023149_32200 [Mucilaginibacter gynuensis]|uniref:Glycosyltransferase 2-like domain-containing protein n=1 Tax=Mucilaginibacter gynuensis TaxID=1302236 RepID=A0ABP8GQ36_9SPHI